MVIWYYKSLPFLSKFNLPVRKQLSGADFFYFDCGDIIDMAVNSFSNDVRMLIEEHGGNNKRLAADKVMIHVLRALGAQGFEVIEGEEVTEKSLSIKGADEILAMFCASPACKVAVAEMEQVAREGVPKEDMSEDDIWAVLRAENVRRSGDVIETRLLTSGPCTKPLFQECGLRLV